jgi:hypothetical protein
MFPIAQSSCNAPRVVTLVILLAGCADPTNREALTKISLVDIDLHIESLFELTITPLNSFHSSYPQLISRLSYSNSHALEKAILEADLK